MSLAFLLPAGLFALAALALPLLIHLARRSEHRPTPFAALRWLSARPRPRTRIRFDEWLLLAVRLLLLAMIAVLLARPVLSGADDASPVVAIMPGAVPPAPDALPPDARVVWLAPGFPAYRAGEVAPAPGTSPTSLLRELDADLPVDVAVTVVVPGVLDGVDAQRPRLSRRVDWRVVPPREVARIAPRSPPAPHLAIRYAPSHRAAVRYVHAAGVAMEGPGESQRVADVAPVDRALDAKARHLAWLAPGVVPAHVRDWVRRGGVVLLDAGAQWPALAPMPALWRDDAGALVEGTSYGQGRVLRFTRELTPRQVPSLLDGAFPDRLRELLEPPPPMPARVLASAHAPLPGAPAFLPAPRDLQPWLVLAIVALFALERVLATAHRGRDAP